MIATDEQEDAIGMFLSGVDMAVEAGAGCLSGETVVHVNRGGKASRMRLAHVVARLHGAVKVGRTMGGRSWDLSIPTMVAVADDGVARLGRVEDAWCSGERDTFTLATMGGRVIRATEQHPFLTIHGWRHLRDLSPGDIVAVNTGRSALGRGPRRHYRTTDTRCHPHQVRRSIPRDRWAVPTHRLVVEADMNGLPFDVYVALLRRPESIEGLIFLSPEDHVHHIDDDPLNNERSNLRVMPAADHHRHHAEAGAGDNVLWQVGADTVASITLAGVEVTYDLALAEAPHNFIADGLVVHNTGKTSTLVLIAEEMSNRRGQYAVFNRAAVNDATRRMPLNVAASTINSIAARSTDRALMNRLNSHRRPSWQTARELGIHQSMRLTVDGKTRILSPSWLSGHVMRALREFCFSADPEPTIDHFPVVVALDVALTFPNNRELAGLLLPHLERAWADMNDPDGTLRYTHDAYVKAWALGDPQLPVDFLMVDEAQDLSPVHIGVFSNQACQVIWVGDSQQQIYEWRGARNALLNLPVDTRTFLTRSFRFGPAIATAANRVLAMLPTEMRLTGDPGRHSTVGRLAVGNPQAVLTRTNAVSVERVLNYQARGVPVHLVGGGFEVIAFAKAAERLQESGECDHPEIGCFASWKAVQEYVAEDPLGSELRLLVELVDKFGADKIIEALDDMISEDAADVVVSTAHKAKGREWETVQLGGDFPEYAECEPEDWRLLYVAVTRARVTVDPYNTEVWRVLEAHPTFPLARAPVA